MRASVDETTNYTFASIEKTLTISKATPSIYFGGYTSTREYNGAAMELPAAEELFVTGASLSEVTYTWYSGDSPVAANQLDAAVWEGDVHNPSLVGREIGRDHLQMICSPEHPLARHGSVAPQVLCMQNFLLREKGSAVRDLFDLRMGELGLAVEPLWESVSTQAIVHAVAQDIGVSVLPYALVRGDAEQRRIACVEIDGLDLSRKLRLVYRKNKYISPQLHSFFEIVAGEGKAGAARHEAARK